MSEKKLRTAYRAAKGTVSKRFLCGSYETLFWDDAKVKAVALYPKNHAPFFLFVLIRQLFFR
jgi:hypothetical protein